VFTPRFHLLTRPLFGLQREAVGQLLARAGADAVVVVAREEEAAELLEDARIALEGARAPVPLILQIVGPLSAAGHHALAARVPVMASPEEAFGAAMQAVADRFGHDVPSDADPAVLGAVQEFRHWSTLPFKRGPAQTSSAPSRETQVSPKVLLIIVAVLFAILAFGIIVGVRSSS
jgi:NAD(P)-dependent dehydrogenase (short-subunit alcohol dehydrogenase family)